MASAMGKGRERSDMQIFFFFPTVEQRLKLWIPITPEFTAIVSDHGKTKAYLNRFNLTDNMMCPCNERKVCGTSDLCMQNTGTPNKLHDTTYYNQRRDLAPHKQRTSSQILKTPFHNLLNL
jgi:hypothetical protein